MSLQQSSTVTWAQNDRFLGSLAASDEALTVILGAPLDGTASFWPGSRFAPSRIRSVSSSLEEYSPMLDRSLDDLLFFDAGDLDLPLGDVGTALARIAATLREEVLAVNKVPFLLGGEHLVTLPAITAVYERFPDLAVVHFDAHTDLRESYLGVAQSHATVMRHVCTAVGPQNLYQFGIRSGSRDEFLFAQENTRFFPYEVLGPLRTVLPELIDRPVYVTLDIDVIDPGFAPGTGTPEPGGCTPQEIFAALQALRAVQVVGFDLVELCPLAETGVTTSVLAAKLLREALLSFGR